MDKQINIILQVGKSINGVGIKLDIEMEIPEYPVDGQDIRLEKAIQSM